MERRARHECEQHEDKETTGTRIQPGSWMTRQDLRLAFESVYRHEGRCIVTVRAQMEGPSDASMSVHFDRDTGEVQYPVEIVLTANPVSFTLDSDDMCSCTLPPAVPGDMVDGIRDTLRLFHDVVAQARKLIEEERNRLRENG